MDEGNKNIYRSKPPVLWKPKEDSGKHMKTFMKKLEKKYRVKMDNFWDCHKWSLENIDKFWAEMWEDSEIIHSQSYDKVVDLTRPLHEFQDWFSGARLNYAENLLKYRDDRIALIAAGEEKETKEFTFAEVYEESKLYAAALKKHGVKKGDKVACFMSNREEAVFAMLGTTSLGAMWLGALPLMGSQAVLNRFNTVHPKILFTVDRFQHAREEKDMLPKLKDISENLSSLEKIVIVASKPDSKLKDITLIRNSCFLDEFLESGKNDDGSVPEMVFEQVSFNYPVFLNYTSGTSGMPKALYHGCTYILAVYRDFQLSNHSDRNTCWLSVSPVGWTSWNMFASMLFLGYTVILFEGDPFFLSPTYLWDMVDELKITNLLLTTSVMDGLQRKNYLPLERHHLSSLRFVMSGGSVVKPQNFEFFYSKIKKDCLFTAAYGSTEMSGTQFISNELLEVHLAEIPGPLLGTDAEVLDESGNAIFGEVGDLVTTKPTPNMPRVWGDTDGSIFKNTYFEKYPDASAAYKTNSLRELGILRTDECKADAKEPWTYRGKNGPDYWGKIFPTCDGNMQSPIAINNQSAVYDKTLAKLSLNKYEISVRKAIIENNGHSVQITPTDGVDRTIAVNGSTYNLVQLHFHWGDNYDKGSEHTLDGKRFALEMHLVHKNRKNQVAVVGVFFQEQDTKNSELQTIVEAFPKVMYKGNKSYLPLKLNLNKLLPANPSTVYRYMGSLTTPGCDESVTWSIITKHLLVGNEQMAEFRKLYSAEKNDVSKNCKLSNNFRPVQPLNGRKVYISQ